MHYICDDLFAVEVLSFTNMVVEVVIANLNLTLRENIRIEYLCLLLSNEHYIDAQSTLH